MKINAAIPIALLLVLCSCGEQSQAPPARPQGPAEAPPVVDAPAGGVVNIRLVPETPTSSDCLRVLGQGRIAGTGYVWLVNGRQVATKADNLLCSDAFKRGDQVTVQAGGASNGGSVSVTIANSPPKVTGLSATPDQVFADSNIQVVPVAEDQDGDPVQFRYQWLINGTADSFLTENTLTGNHLNRGDVIQVRITPFDGFDEGPVYESYAMTIPNAPPRITSNPPRQFAALEYSYQVTAGDADGDSLAWRLDTAPTGMTISPAGLISWPLTGVAPGAYPLKIVVSDPVGAEAFQEYTLTLGEPK